MHLFSFIFEIVQRIQYCTFILSNLYKTFIRRHSLRFLFISSSLISMGKPPWGAEPRIELGPVLQKADALPTELRRTLTELRLTKMLRSLGRYRICIVQYMYNTVYTVRYNSSISDLCG
jgi:hypothetical protein